MQQGKSAGLYSLNSDKYDIPHDFSSFGSLVDASTTRSQIAQITPGMQLSWWIKGQSSTWYRITMCKDDMALFIQGFISVMCDAVEDFRDYSCGLPHTMNGTKIREFLVEGYDIASVWHSADGGVPARILPYSMKHQDPRTQI